VFFSKNINTHLLDYTGLHWKYHNINSSLLTQQLSQTWNMVFDVINLCNGPVRVQYLKNLTFSSTSNELSKVQD
jgi:hypothetical protein